MTEQEITNLIKEKEINIKNLQQEVDFLKQQLKTNRTENNLSRDEKIGIYMSYFRGREDVYPAISFNKHNPNIKFFSPACANEMNYQICNKMQGKKCKTCHYRENIPLTKETIYNHMYGNKPIGIYPLLKDNTCYFLAIDFDNKDNNKEIKEEVIAFANVCEKYEVPIAIERSRSGHGIHIWIFFNENIKAITARKLGSLLLSKTMEVENIPISSFDRMFPNQDTLPKRWIWKFNCITFSK